MIKFILLGFLNYQPMTGYELKQVIDGSSAHFWHAHHSQIYSTLRQMEQDELVTSELRKEDKTPDRRIYTITSPGRIALKNWLDKMLTETSPIKEELLVRLFFSAQRDPQDVLTELHLQRELHQRKEMAYQAAAQAIPQIKSLERDVTFWRLTVELGMRYEKLYLDWLEYAIQKIKET